ncbi:ribonuclease J [Alphaproteobacteria bacterium]|nr:ribonuclease J [Alphaproteobacteria bacterium]
MKFKKDNLGFVPVGGSEQIGMNANLYQFNDQWILVDLGIAFPDETQIGVDILLPDFDFIKKIKNKLLGIFLTHAHEDHYGAIQYFIDEINCPIWGSEFTLAMLKKKLLDNGSKNKLTLKHYPRKSSIRLNEFEIDTIQNSHSVPQSVSLLIKTKKNIILHTGDWKFKGAKNLKEKPFIDELKDLKISTIVSDSTNSLIDGYTPSENDAYKGLKKIISKSKGMIIITCFSSNISRIKSILEISKINEKKVFILGRAIKRSIEAAIDVGLIEKNYTFYGINEIEKFPKKNLLVICSGSQGEPNSSLTRIASGKIEKIKLDNQDSIIFSSKKIPGNERKISKVEHMFMEKNVNIVNEENNKSIHVSGHPCKDEIFDMYKILKPKSVIPVHGNFNQLKANAEIAKSCKVKNILIPRNGDVFEFSNDCPNCVERIEMDTKVFDGEKVVSLKDEKFSIRKQALWNGILMASLVLDNKGNLISVPLLTEIGISNTQKMKNALLEISLKIEDFIEGLNELETSDDDNLKDVLKKIILKEIKLLFSIRPIINIHINRVQ